MSNTTDLITALVNIGAFVGKDEKGRIVAKFDGRINTSVDENQHLHIYHKGSLINLSAHKYEISSSEIILSPK